MEVPAGVYRDITLHDGSTMRLETISDDHDISDAVAALSALHKADADRKHVMGLLYFDGDKPSLEDDLELHDTPIVELDDQLKALVFVAFDVFKTISAFSPLQIV